MRSMTTLKLALTAILTCITIHALAVTSSGDPNRLGQDLTPLGGEMAGNEDGTIPPWEGGITTPPSNYKPGGYHPDPYPEDSVLFTIDASNMDQYRDQLSLGHQRMLEQYPTFKIPAYPTRRSASAPQYIYDATKSLVGRASLEKDGNGVNNAIIGIPFPMPKSGIEVIWNHILRYRGQNLETRWGSAAVTKSGNYTITEYKVDVIFRYSQPGMILEELKNLMIFYKSRAIADGEIILVRETINQKRKPRGAWKYRRGERRARRAPSVAYDGISSQKVDGLRRSDQVDMYNGAPDRYNWQLIGKREMYVPYNSYKLHQLTPEDVIIPRHLNPDHLRYELHRIWIVEATLKPGAKHIFTRRVFYIDEDSWNILLVDVYDKNNNLSQVQEAHVINYYEAQVFMPTVEVFVHLDHKERGRYLASGLNTGSDPPLFNGNHLDERDFTPQAIRREGR